MDRKPLLDALAGLSDSDFEHVAHVCHDIGRRLPETHAALGTASRTVLGIPEPVVEEELEGQSIAKEDVGTLGVGADGSVNLK